MSKLNFAIAILVATVAVLILHFGFGYSMSAARFIAAAVFSVAVAILTCFTGGFIVMEVLDIHFGIPRKLPRL